MTPELFTQMKVALQYMENVPEVRFKVLTGTGGAFSQGVDLNFSAEIRTVPDKTRWVELCQDGAKAIGPNNGKRTIVALNGPALGGGLELRVLAPYGRCGHGL